LNSYGDDLAWIHHAGFSEFAESAAPWFAAILPRGLVVDIGCGSGVLARELTRAGFDVLGIDASPSMIALARQNAPRARFEAASFNTFAIPPCDAITAIGEVLNYGRREDLLPFFQRAAASARMLVFDIAERGSYPPHDERRVGGDDWSVIAIKDSDSTRLTRRVITFRHIAGSVRRSEETHELELYERDEVVQMLHDSGFDVRIRRSYGRRRLPKGHGVYLATRRN